MRSKFTVFFFKQKTPYGMRISDLSSDVCSSDLGSVSPRRDQEIPGIRIGLHARLAPAGRQARFGLAAAPSSPPSPPRGAAQLPRRTPRHHFITNRKLRALTDLNVHARFLQAFNTTRHRGFGLMGTLAKTWGGKGS